MKSKEMETFEIDYFLEAIFKRYGYGYDFRHYACASLKRRIHNRLALSGLNYISEMVPKVLYDEGFFENILNDMSITVTQMFRTPEVFKKIREQIVPKLRAYSQVNIWHAGCATGEEVYSMAIVLQEEGLLERCRIYATDFNKRSLEIAGEGIYPLEVMQSYSKNYHRSGGKHSFSDFYWAKYDSAKMRESLRDNITFAHHNLMRDKRGLLKCI